MRLLLTRPEPDASRSAARLEGLGHELLVEPLLTIHAMPQPALAAPPVALLLTSRNAVRALTTWPAHAAWRQSLPLFAVGDATALAAREAGFANVVSAGGAVDDLADVVTSRLNPADGPLLYVAGENRAGDLEGELRAAGFAVDTAISYLALAAAALSQAARGAIDAGWVEGALFYSPRTAAIFANLATGFRREALGAITAFALSAEVAAPLRPVGFGQIASATHPDEARLIALLGA